MKRYLLGALATVLVSGPLSAQVPVSVASGYGGFGGGVIPSTPSLSAPIMRPGFPAFSPLGSLVVRPIGGFPMVGGPSFGFGYGGGPYLPSPYLPVSYGNYFSGYYGAGYYGGYYGGGYYGIAPTTIIIESPAAAPVAATASPSPSPPVQLSGETTGSLVLQFPAPAIVWMDGRQVEGKPSDQWTLVSPPLKPGEKYVFSIKAQWKSGGKTYESTQEATVGPGDRSRLGVLSGTAVNE